MKRVNKVSILAILLSLIMLSAAADLSAQRKATKRMAGLLLRDTPVITDYFINYVTASTSRLKNYVPDGISQVRLAKVSLA